MPIGIGKAVKSIGLLNIVFGYVLPVSLLKIDIRPNIYIYIYIYREGNWIKNKTNEWIKEIHSKTFEIKFS